MPSFVMSSNSTDAIPLCLGECSRRLMDRNEDILVTRFPLIQHLAHVLRLNEKDRHVQHTNHPNLYI